MTFRKFLCFSIVLVIASCAGNTVNNKMIVGKWVGIEWLVQNAPSKHNAVGTSFTFDDKGNYTFDYAGTLQKGTYKVENDMLFTRPTGEAEIMVRIEKLTGDSLVFLMNRGGSDEKLTLFRNK